MERQRKCADTSSPNSVASMTRTCETASTSGKTLYSLQTPQTEFANQSAGRNLESFQTRRPSSQVVPCTTSVSQRGNHEMESRKRKLHFCRSESVPTINLEPEFLLQSETAAARDSFHHGDTNSDTKEDAFYDDQFYEGLDLDAVEAQATLLLKQKSEMSITEQDVIPQLHPQNCSLLSSPSFDLGI
jgi:Fanconi anemia group M protein